MFARAKKCLQAAAALRYTVITPTEPEHNMNRIANLIKSIDAEWLFVIPLAAPAVAAVAIFFCR
jgi:hypothetical protein